MKDSSDSMKEASSEDLQTLQEESFRQEIQIEYSKHQAQVAQELAIAKRIENAVEVEIEEYYDNSGKSDNELNVSMKAQTAGLGISSENRRVSKRVYRFKGNTKEEYTQSFQND